MGFVIDNYGAIAELSDMYDPRILIEGPANCVAGETELWDPLARRGRRIDELVALRKRPWVQTLIGPILAEVPFCKGFAPLYRVTLESGASCLVTADHRFLAFDERAGPVYAYLSDLVPGTLVLSARGAGARRSSRTAPDSRAGCPSESRSDDGRLLGVSEDVRGSAPSRSGVREPVHADSLQGVPAATAGRNPTYPASDLRASEDAVRLSPDAPLGVPLPEALARLAARCRVASDIRAHGASSSRSLHRLPSATRQPQPSGARQHRTDDTRSRALASPWSPCTHDGPEWVHVATIKYERTDFYFDLTVPLVGHYLADGLYSKNTGKSSGILRIWDRRSWECPGIRVLLLRQTMQSLRESILATLEEKVWGPIVEAAGRPKYPAQNGTAKRDTRRKYVYPTGSEWVIGGLEDPGWTFSMEYDGILGFEAWEFSRDSIEKLYRANRNHVLCRYAPWNQGLAALVRRNWMDPRWVRWHGTRDPEKLAKASVSVRGVLTREEGFGCWQQIVLDTNPHSEFSQLNLMAAPIGGEEVQRIKTTEMPSRRVFRSDTHPFTRVLSRHVDNPACTDDDLVRLRAQTGHRRANLYLGLWTSAEGQIWPTFDPTIHMQTIELEREGERDTDAKVDERIITMRFLGDRHPALSERIEVKWTFGAMDFGFRNAGVLQVWGVDYDDRIFRLVEIHRREMFDDWWTERVLEMRCEFNLYAVTGDCEDAERIVKMNDRLSQAGRAKRGGLAIVQGVDKSVRRGNRTRFVPTSLDLVREMLDPGQKGGPRMFWRRDALREGVCPISRENLWPTSSEQEIPSFAFEEREDGKPDDEEPDKGCKQDGCAATRYAAVYFWLMDPKGQKTEPRIKPGTAGARMGHAAVLAKSARWTR